MTILFFFFNINGYVKGNCFARRCRCAIAALWQPNELQVANKQKVWQVSSGLWEMTGCTRRFDLI